MSFQGLDPEAVTHTGDTLDRQAAALGTITSNVDGLIRTAMHHWSGPEAQDFHQWWVGQHRPRLVAAVQALQGAARGVRQQVAEQDRASGVSASPAGAGGGFGRDALAVGGGLLLAAGSTFREAWNNVIPSTLRTVEETTEGYVKIARGEDAAFKTPGFKLASKALGVIGFALDGVDLVDGLRNKEYGTAVTGGGGIVLTALTVAGGVAAAPVAVPGAAVVAVASTVMPTSNQDYANAYDDAMRRQFGDAYDPENATPEQVAWGSERYEGVGGFFNSIGDGLQSKAGRWWGLRG